MCPLQSVCQFSTYVLKAGVASRGMTFYTLRTLRALQVFKTYFLGCLKPFTKRTAQGMDINDHS